MKLTLDPKTAIALQVLLEDKKVKEGYERLVKCFMETANVSEEEAKQTIGPEWIRGCVKRAQEMVLEIEQEKSGNF